MQIGWKIVLRDNYFSNEMSSSSKNPEHVISFFNILIVFRSRNLLWKHEWTWWQNITFLWWSTSCSTNKKKHFVFSMPHKTKRYRDVYGLDRDLCEMWNVANMWQNVCFVSNVATISSLCRVLKVKQRPIFRNPHTAKQKQLLSRWIV